MTGDAICECTHSWVAVAPVGTVWLVCPRCGTQKGRFKFPVNYAIKEVWTCQCSNQLFYITKDGAYCPMCGDWQQW